MEGWNARTEEVSEFIATEGFDEQLKQVIQFQLNFGNENTEQQERVWDSIKSMIRGLDGSPVRRGKKSNLPASVNVAIDQICGEVQSLHSGLFNSNPVLQAVMLKHGKSGGGSYDSGDEYGAAISSKVRTLLKNMYVGKTNDNGELTQPEWDGTVSGLTATITVAEEEE
mgnify:FL=1|tara:strand:+ start:5611 stop:6117 length:507 start_codon:yes stop_codon:yes gene_type:complete